MVAKLLDFNNISWQRWPFALANDGRKVCSISGVIDRKFIPVHFFFFFFLPCLQDHSFLRSRNFVTMATWRNDFSIVYTLGATPLGHTTMLNKNFIHVSFRLFFTLYCTRKNEATYLQLKPGCHMLGKSQAIGDLTFCPPCQILPIYRTLSRRHHVYLWWGNWSPAI